MPINLSIKNVPDDVAARLRERARRAHRSLQGELLAILETAVAGSERLSAADVLREVRGLGYSTSDEATAWIRAERDAR